MVRTGLQPGCRRDRSASTPRKSLKRRRQRGRIPAIHLHRGGNMKVAIGLFAALLLTTTLLPAQSINIDLGQPGAPRPPSTYRAAGLPGYWNKFDATNSSTYYSL